MSCDSQTTVSPRNLSLWRRHLQGEQQVLIGKEMGISQARTWQIFHSVDNRVRRALNSLRPNAEPYVYGVWFHFELGKRHPRIEP